MCQSAEFFMRYAGSRMLPASEQTGDAVADTRRVLSMNHPLHTGKALRLSSCWMVITPQGVTTSFKAHPSTGFDTGGSKDRKSAIKEAVAAGDCMILALGKRSTQVSDLFITYDARAVRICGQGEVETINILEDKKWM